ncbi:MAG: winged helix-turn-helix domain-containing protein [Zoogloeaceae bacterium]|jgi:ATP-dependent DNA helicase RecG|nr:winged helix-turn-helix domain-containing protein [Zoogloeaceae bacterium]
MFNHICAYLGRFDGTVEIPDAKAEDMDTRDFILAAIRDNPSVTTPGLAKATGMTLKGMKWHLRKLRDEKRIIHVGPTKGGR